jgi:hypothetical protein
MTLLRLIPLQLNAALETILAPVMIVAPFALGFSPAALVVSVLLGVALMGTALSTSVALAGQREGIRVSAHASLDLGLALVLIVCSFAFGLSQDPAAGFFFGAIAIVQALLATTTRYRTLPA